MINVRPSILAARAAASFTINSRLGRVTETNDPECQKRYSAHVTLAKFLTGDFKSTNCVLSVTIVESMGLNR